MVFNFSGKRKMSFWDQSPGPHWSDFWKSCLPFRPSIYPHIIDENIKQISRPLTAPRNTKLIYLHGDHSEALEKFIQTYYKITERSKVCLTHARIRNGFTYDSWLGCGLQDTSGNFIGCCISRSLGVLRLGYQEFADTGVVDYFCVADSWRKKGVASFLLQELVFLTASKHRLVHLFIKEGFPLGPLPPIWQSHYVVRKRGLPDSYASNLHLMDISLRARIHDFIHTKYIPDVGTILNKPNVLSGDSQLYTYQEGKWRVFLCITDTFHRSVPEAWRIGEITWMLAVESDTPYPVQQRAIETLVDNCKFEIVLLDTTWAHDSSKGWKKDAMYGWYLFNCNPGKFFSMKPYFVF